MSIRICIAVHDHRSIARPEHVCGCSEKKLPGRRTHDRLWLHLAGRLAPPSWTGLRQREGIFMDGFGNANLAASEQLIPLMKRSTKNVDRLEWIGNGLFLRLAI